MCEVEKRARRFVSSSTTGLALAILVCGAIAGFALWYSSAGHFPVFPPIQNDYVDLGNAFLHGKLSLLEQPNPQLAALPNPYDYKERKNLTYHWDASYYNGKYYLYWGPVPGLVSAALEAVARVLPSGPVLVVIPYLGSLAVFLAILIQISTYFPGSAARLSLGLFVVIGFANLPLLYTIGQPRHYQASILYGQFFLLTGLLAFALYTSAKRPGLLIAAGLGWGLAVGCRYNLAISVAIYLVFAIIWLGRMSRFTGLLERIGLIAAPLAILLIGLGIYNLVRFGNPIETGVAYQLGLPQVHKLDISLSYFPSNLYIYLSYPLSTAGSFPFIQPAHFHPNVVPDWLTIPPGSEFDQVVLGIFSSVPAVWLSALVIPYLILIARRVIKRQTFSPHQFQRNFLFAMISSAAAGQFLFLMVYFYGAERFVIDFYPSLILGITILVWQTDESLRLEPLRLALWLIVAGLTIWTAGIGFFGCFGLPTLIAPYYDPALVARLATYWNPLHAGFQALLNFEWIHLH